MTHIWKLFTGVFICNNQSDLPVTGFIHFFVDRIQDFFQTIFFIFQTQGNSVTLHGLKRNNCLNYENNARWAKKGKNQPQIWPNYFTKYVWNATNMSLTFEDNELIILLLYFSYVIVSKYSWHICGLALCISKQPILWRHQLWRHK